MRFCKSILATALCAAFGYVAPAAGDPQSLFANKGVGEGIDEVEIASGPLQLLKGSFKRAESGPSLEEMAGQMVLVGFLGDSVDHDWFRAVVSQMEEGKITGVIYLKRNVRNKSNVIKMNAALRRAAGDRPALIALDQEGGMIERLTPNVGFPHTFSAAKVANTLSTVQARDAYQTMAGGLREWGFNLNFGPVVDLNVNPGNPIIGRLGRSFSSDPVKVIDYASAFLDGHHREHVMTALKHFPGHGSSVGDSHLGAVDVSKTWSEKELEPYRALIREGNVDMVMSAHVRNDQLQKKGDTGPMSLSPALRETLRKKLGFKGVVVSDDMQMDAIRANYSIKDAVLRAVRAGNDILIFANDKHPDLNIPEKVISILAEEAKKDDGLRIMITNAYERILRLKSSLGITDSIQGSMTGREFVPASAAAETLPEFRTVLTAELVAANSRDVRLSVPAGMEF